MGVGALKQNVSLSARSWGWEEEDWGSDFGGPSCSQEWVLYPLQAVFSQNPFYSNHLDPLTFLMDSLNRKIALLCAPKNTHTKNKTKQQKITNKQTKKTLPTSCTKYTLSSNFGWPLASEKLDLGGQSQFKQSQSLCHQYSVIKESLPR